MKKLSVIIPAYNAEKYISDCVHSILNSDYQNIEVVAVDDGSKDKTPNILDDLSKEDSRVVVYHNTNHGVSYSRNFGIDHATGEYLAFVDADDLVTKEMYSSLIHDLESNNASVSACGYQTFYEEKEIKLDEKPEDKVFVHTDRNDILCNMVYNDNSIEGLVWNKVYRKDVIGSEQRFRSDVAINDDAVFSWELFENAGLVVTFRPDKMYKYRIIPTSITRNSNLDKHKKSLKACKIMIDSAKEICPQALQGLYEGYVVYLLTAGVKASYCKDKAQKKEMIGFVKAGLKEAKPYKKNMPITLKLKFSLYIFSRPMYLVAYRIKH